jgi:hypothetical protein
MNDLRVIITNIEGRKLYEQVIAHAKGAQHANIDMVNYRAGVYFMIFSDSEGRYEERFRVVRK